LLELTPPEIPIVPGHEIVGVVDVVGDGVTHLAIGDRVGIPWLGHTCGACGYCAGGRENLCRDARFTGFDMDGGYAEYAVADAACGGVLSAGQITAVKGSCPGTGC
jgi:propanol-preferring alcohol dehydrogenase